jgi:3'-5' exoribonuclease
MSQALEKLREMAAQFNGDIVALSAEVLDNPKFEVWSGSPRPTVHHYGKGGLAQHTLEVSTMCLQNVRYFNSIGYSIDEGEMFLAALYHDVGKIWDYNPINAEMTEWTSADHKYRVYHIVRSALYWSQALEKTGLGKPMEDNVLHSILAHHGCREWGSPVTPQTRAAWILHLCDNMSARVADCDLKKLEKPMDTK